MNEERLKKAWEAVEKDIFGQAPDSTLSDFFWDNIRYHCTARTLDEVSLVDIGWRLRQEYARLEREE